MRSGSAMTLVPNLRFLVRAAAKERATIGSMFRRGETMRSLSQMESMSSSSQVSTYRQRCSGSSLGKGQPPNPMPILMDMVFLTS